MSVINRVIWSVCRIIHGRVGCWAGGSWYKGLITGNSANWRPRALNYLFIAATFNGLSCFCAAVLSAFTASILYKFPRTPLRSTAIWSYFDTIGVHHLIRKGETYISLFARLNWSPARVRMWKIRNCTPSPLISHLDTHQGNTFVFIKLRRTFIFTYSHWWSFTVDCLFVEWQPAFVWK